MKTQGQTPLLGQVLALAGRGFSMVPSTGASKAPCVKWKAYQQRAAEPAQLQEWERRFRPIRWGVVTGAVSGFVVADFDGEAGARLLGRWGLRPHVRTGSGGFHAWFAHPGRDVPTLNARSSSRTWPWPGLDIRGDGGFAVVLGRNAAGHYQLLREPEPEPWDALPAEVRDFLLGAPEPPAADARFPAERLLRRALDQAPVRGRNNAGAWLAFQLRDNSYTADEAACVMHDYRARAGSVNTKGAPESYTSREVAQTIREAYSRPPRQPLGSRPAPAVASGDAARDLLSGFAPNDMGNAERLMALYGEGLRYVFGFHSWYHWDGRRWARDGSEHSRRCAHRTLAFYLQQARAAGKEAAVRHATASHRSGQISAMLREAHSLAAVAPQEWDTHPHLLNFLNGTVDLRDGSLHAHDRAQMITRLIHHNYRPEAGCPVFLRFLGRVLDAEMVPWMQKALGYSLTGLTSEKAVFFLHGTGDNGKTTLLATFEKLVDEYAAAVLVESLMRGGESANAQADLADLAGARFAHTSETDSGQRVSEARLKRLAQGMGRIKAVRKYENPFEFAETHKLWIDANHLPRVCADDEAVWRRLRLVPFTVSIPREEQDRDLHAKLIGEAEGILAWAVAGAARWHREGLGRPEASERAAGSWRAECDAVKRFLDERTEARGGAAVRASELYEAYQKWAAENGERVESKQCFGRRITGLGIERTSNNGVVYRGFCLA